MAALHFFQMIRRNSDFCGELRDTSPGSSTGLGYLSTQMLINRAAHISPFVINLGDTAKLWVETSMKQDLRAQVTAIYSPSERSCRLIEQKTTR